MDFVTRMRTTDRPLSPPDEAPVPTVFDPHVPPDGYVLVAYEREREDFSFVADYPTPQAALEAATMVEDGDGGYRCYRAYAIAVPAGMEAAFAEDADGVPVWISPWISPEID